MALTVTKTYSDQQVQALQKKVEAEFTFKFFDQAAFENFCGYVITESTLDNLEYLVLEEIFDGGQNGLGDIVDHPTLYGNFV